MSQIHDSTNRRLCLACRNLEEAEARGSSADQIIALKTQVNRSHDPFLHKLPVEIGIRILNMLAECDNEHMHHGEIFCDEERLIGYKLSRVCRVWRQIAIAAPRLWTRIEIKLELFQKKPERLDMYRTQLARSTSSPLLIHIEGNIKNCRTSIPVVFSPLYDLINAHSDRWYKFTHIAPPMFMESLKGNGMPTMVRELHIALVPWWEKNVQHRFQLADAVRPSPQKVFAPPIPFSSFHINWTNVTRATFSTLSNEEFLYFLPLSPCLTFCTVVDMSAQGAEAPETESIHRGLESLDIILRSHIATQTVLQCCTLPSLTSLKLHNTRGLHGSDWFISLVERSSFPLVNLTMREFENRMDFCAFLDLLPTLENILFEKCHFNAEDIFRRLLATTSDGTFLPNLAVLEYHADSWTVPWELIPELFPPEETTTREDATDASSTGTAVTARHRPFAELAIIVNDPSAQDDPDDWDPEVEDLDETVLRQMLRLKERGFHLYIEENQINLIDVSEEFYAESDNVKNQDEDSADEAEEEGDDVNEE